jgi:hypothetical protein
MPLEVNAYKWRIQDIIQTQNWVTVTKEEYETAIKVDNDLLADFVENINRLTKANNNFRSNFGDDF